MSRGFKAVWLGDSDPSAQLIRMGDLTFVKGESVTVPADHGYADMVKDNPMFAVDAAKAEPAAADEPDAEALADRMDEGTEKGALKTELRKMGVDVRGNPSVETLRNKLVEATK